MRIGDSIYLEDCADTPSKSYFVTQCREKCDSSESGVHSQETSILVQVINVQGMAIAHSLM